jgi:hypothetical protein
VKVRCKYALTDFGKNLSGRALEIDQASVAPIDRNETRRSLAVMLPDFALRNPACLLPLSPPRSPHHLMICENGNGR